MKRMLSVVCCLVIFATLLLSLTACGTSIQDDWGTIILGKYLPTPQEGKLRSGSNLDNIFMGGIENVKDTYYAEYKKACIDMGYVVESKESGNSYDAFNTAGYKLSLSYYGGDIHITLEAPVELIEIEWPKTGLGAKLPTSASSLGKVTSDSSKSFAVIIGNTDMDGYNEYVKACEEKGFTEDYTKADGRYEAKDAEGYRLVVRYVGCNHIEITLQTPKKDDSSTTPSIEETKGNDDTSNTIRKEFKEAMDGYEQFMNEYVTFMKKYIANPTDLSLLTDYAVYASKYTDFVKKFEKWDNEELNAAETAYYIDVQARVSKKLLEIAQ